MKISAAFKIFLLSFCVAVATRYGQLEFESWNNEKRTADLCAAVGNYLETGNLREAFEGLEYGVARSGVGKTCIGILDNSRSYAPNCIDADTAYQTITCKAEANSGVRAHVMYAKDSLFGFKLLSLWGLVALGFFVLIFILKHTASRLSLQVVKELHLQILGNPDPRKDSLVGQLSDWVLSRLGIRDFLMKQTQDFEDKIRNYESRLIEESTLRVQKETEVAKARAYAENIKKIRHDIRSPITGLLAVQEALDPTDELLHSTFSSATKSLQSLVEKLGDFEAENMAPRLAILEVIAEQAIQSMRLKFLKRKNISLNFHYQTKSLSPVFVVSDSLLRIFENLLENSYDALSENGVIVVSVESSSSHCQIIFEDDGCGISPDAASLLFEEGATFGKLGGTGLGLYHAKRNLKAWGGTISFDPKPVGGARFKVTLPLAQTGVIFKSRPENLRVVVIDDDPKMPGALERVGFNVVASAVTPNEGRRILKQSEIPTDTIVLMDQDLGNGVQGTDLIAEVPGTRKVYLCTHEFDSPKVIQRAKELGVGIIPKPLIIQPLARISPGWKANAEQISETFWPQA